MKQTFKALVIASFAVAVVAPLTVSAAWWNPFSWFKKTTPAATVNTEVKVNVGTNTNTQTNASTSVEVKPATQPIVQTVKPVVVPKPASTSKPTASSSTSSKPVVNSSTTTTIVVDVPVYALNSQFTSSGFVAPRNVKNGTTLLTIEALPGKVQAIGTWYVDSITWRMVSDTYRSGDLTVSVTAGQKVYEDSSVINESHTTKISSHVASDPISFTINGQTPRKGTVRIEIESIKGHTSTNSNIEYSIGGTPLVGPDFSISSN